MIPPRRHPALTKRQQHRLNNIVASAHIENADLDQDAVNRLTRVMTGVMTGDQARAAVLRKYVVQ